MTDLFAVAARLDPHTVDEAIPPSARRGVELAPTAQRVGSEIVIDLGPWTPRAPARHLLPSLAVLAPRPPSVRFEVSGRRGGPWSPWLGTAPLGDAPFAPLPTEADGIAVDIDEIHATPPIEAVRVRVRAAGPGAEALLDAPWVATLSAWDGSLAGTATDGTRVHLAVPPRSQMTEPEPDRLRICSPTSVAMALAYLGCDVPTMTMAAEVFHRGTDRYGVWPAAVRAAAARGRPGYLLRFADWASVAWCLARGLPIVASVRYGAGELTHGAMPDTTGHLIVITGLEGDDVLVNDPAAPTIADVPRRYARSELTRVWLERAGVGYVFFAIRGG